MLKFTVYKYTGVKGQGSFLQRGVSGPRQRLPLASPPKPLPSLSQALIGDSKYIRTDQRTNADDIFSRRMGFRS